jgi:hypothetical protein
MQNTYDFNGTLQIKIGYGPDEYFEEVYSKEYAVIPETFEENLELSAVTDDPEDRPITWEEQLHERIQNTAIYQAVYYILKDCQTGDIQDYLQNDFRQVSLCLISNGETTIIDEHNILKLIFMYLRRQSDAIEIFAKASKDLDDQNLLPDSDGFSRTVNTLMSDMIESDGSIPF